MLCSPSCGSQNFLRLGAPKNFDRCANTSSLFLPPAAVRPCCPKQARRDCATPRYIQFNILYNLISACSLLALQTFSDYEIIPDISGFVNRYFRRNLISDRSSQQQEAKALPRSAKQTASPQAKNKTARFCRGAPSRLRMDFSRRHRLPVTYNQQTARHEKASSAGIGFPS